MDDLKTAFRGVMLRDIRPIEDKDGVRVGEDVRITRETEKEKGKDGGATYYLVRYLKDTKESRRKQVRDQLNGSTIKFKEGKDFKD